MHTNIVGILNEAGCKVMPKSIFHLRERRRFPVGRGQGRFNRGRLDNSEQ
jgi:hypothetical protein